MMREGVTNALGLPGALIASWMVDSMFGILVLIPIVLLGFYALKILFEFEWRGWKIFFCSLFCMIWGSITLGFAQALIPNHSFFRWGGAFGE